VANISYLYSESGYSIKKRNWGIPLIYYAYDQITPKILGTSTIGNVIGQGTIIEYHRHNIMTKNTPVRETVEIVM
jgi:hypothetical protein